MGELTLHTVILKFVTKPVSQFQLNFLPSEKKPSIQANHETEDDDMDQNIPDSDRSNIDESQSASGTENEDSSGKTPYYRLQSM